MQIPLLHLGLILKSSDSLLGRIILGGLNARPNAKGAVTAALYGMTARRPLPEGWN
jgi:hypothetical protein